MADSAPNTFFEREVRQIRFCDDENLSPDNILCSSVQTSFIVPTLARSALDAAVVPSFVMADELHVTSVLLATIEREGDTRHVVAATASALWRVVV